MNRSARSLLQSPRSRRAVARLLTASLVVALLTVPATRWGGQGAAVAATSAPTGGFALAGGLGGSVDPRTGQFSVSLPIATVDGAGGAEVAVGLSWQQSRAATSVDRSGWGAGWTMGSSFVSVAGLKRVYPAAGGSYLLDPTEASGLRDYKLRDLTFATKSGTLPARAGAPAVSYGYTLTYDDGRTDYFDVNGNLAARADRFGNQTVLTWQGRANNVWRPTALIDSYGLTTTFDYSVSGVVKVVAPKRSDGVVATTTIALTTTSGVQSVTDPAGQKTVFGYTSVAGAPKPLLTQITAPNGAKTAVSYQSPAYQPSLVVVKTLQVTDANGTAITPAQTFDLDPSGDEQRNFTGYPNHLSTTGNDALFESGDTSYIYSTSLTTGNTTTLTSYDALHRLVNRTVSVAPGVGKIPLVAVVHRPTYATAVRVPGNLPADFAHPSSTALTQSTATSAQGITQTPARTTATATDYDDHGRLVSSTDELGTTTTTAYDSRFGLLANQSTTGPDGSRAEMVNTLSDDGRSILTSTTSVGAAGEELTARQTVAYTYDGRGQLLTRTLSWAPGAEPDDDGPGGGPDQVVTKFDRSVDVTKGTMTLTTTVAAGTTAAETTRSTVDLVTDRATATTDALGRTTTQAYDALGRRTKVTTPAGLTTRTSYTPTTTTSTAADGRVTRTTTDLFGRTTSVTDNVKNGLLTSDPTVRQLSTTSYSADGSSVTGTDRIGRQVKSVVDPFGRTVSQTSPSGVTQLTSYDNGADHDRVDATVPQAATSPSASTVTSFDDGNHALRARTSYAADGIGGRTGVISDPVKAATFNGLGQTETSTTNDLTVTPDHSGLGGIDVGATATPAATDDFPGDPVTATTERDLTGKATSRTLTQGDEVSEAVAVDYDAAGHVVAATDPNGRVTRYTYNDNGQPSTQTEPSGTVTTHTYDPASGLRTGITVTAPGKPTRTSTFTWVPNGQPGAGQVWTVSDGTGTITYGYDADGHRTSVKYPDGTSTAADYDDTGQLDTTTDVTGAVTTYEWDTSGRMHSATQKRGSTTLATATYTYDALSRLSTTTRGNGTVTTTTYSPTSQVATQKTTRSDGTVVEAHSYTYDTHGNPATRTDTYPSGSAVSVPLAGDTWTTAYSYDAFDRLTGSAVHAGPLVDGKPSGVAVSTTAYSVDLGGDVTAKTVTTRLPGPRPIPVTTTTTNTIDDSGRLNTQRVGGTTRSATYDTDGRVVTALNGNITTYTADGSPATVTLPNGSKTVYTYWPDGSRRTAKTTGADGRSSSLVFHYGTDGNLVNDTTTDTATGAGAAVTATYLMTTGREARTLLPGTAASGAVTDTPQTPLTTGGGTGYYLRDRHSSVTSLVDGSGAVTSAYAYSDYGMPVRADGQAVKVSAPVGGRANPYTYLGATPGGPWTSAVTGLLVFPLRSYDPAQGRFTSADPIDAHNRYQAFTTNPVGNADLGGGISTPDIVLDCVFAFVFAASIVFTFGAASAAVGVAAAAFEIGELTVGVVVNAVANVVSLAANVTGGVTSALLAADDITQAATHSKKHLFSSQDRNNISFANQVVTVVGGVSGVAAGISDFTVEASRAATAEYWAKDALRAKGAIPAVPTDAPPPLPTTGAQVGEHVGVPGDGAGNGAALQNPPNNVPGQPPGVGNAGNGGPNVPNGLDNEGPNVLNAPPDLPPVQAPQQNVTVVPNVPDAQQLVPVAVKTDTLVLGLDSAVPNEVQNLARIDASLNEALELYKHNPNAETRDAVKFWSSQRPDTSEDSFTLDEPERFDDANVGSSHLLSSNN